MSDLSFAFGPNDRHRREQRHVTVMIIGRVRGSRGEYPCVVNNVSRNGLKARFARPPLVGERLTFSLRGLPEMAATVRWADGDHGGVEFDRPIEVAAVLNTFGTARMPRPPRFACARASRLTLGGTSRPIALIDVSLGGAKLSFDAIRGEIVGHAGTLLLPVLEQPRVGVVRWHGGERIGFQFARPLTLDVLAALLSRSPG